MAAIPGGITVDVRLTGTAIMALSTFSENYRDTVATIQPPPRVSVTGPANSRKKRNRFV